MSIFESVINAELNFVQNNQPSDIFPNEYIYIRSLKNVLFFKTDLKNNIYLNS